MTSLRSRGHTSTGEVSWWLRSHVASVFEPGQNKTAGARPPQGPVRQRSGPAASGEVRLPSDKGNRRRDRTDSGNNGVALRPSPVCAGRGIRPEWETPTLRAAVCCLHSAMASPPTCIRVRRKDTPTGGDGSGASFHRIRRSSLIAKPQFRPCGLPSSMRPWNIPAHWRVQYTRESQIWSSRRRERVSLPERSVCSQFLSFSALENFSRSRFQGDPNPWSCALTAISFVMGAQL